MSEQNQASNPFQKAVRKKAKLKLAIVGPSGSGKTMGALLMAQGLGKKIALIDTENGSASLYADRFGFDVLNIGPPFTPQKYSELISSAEKLGYDVLIIDSLSHVWAGEGGVLDKKAAIDSRGGNQYANWKIPKAEHAKLKESVLQSDLHLIATIRAKQGYAMVEEGGKNKVQKLGLDPIAEPGTEYEYSVVFDVAMDHNAVVSKDRTGLFDGRIFKITKETGIELNEWLNAAKEEVPKKQIQKIQTEITKEDADKLMNQMVWPKEDVRKYMKLRWNVESISKLSRKDFDDLLSRVSKPLAQPLSQDQNII